MAPIGPNGPGNPSNGSGYLVPLRSGLTPLQPLPKPVRLRSRPTTGSNRKGRLGGGGEYIGAGAVDDAGAPFDPTNKFRLRSGSPDHDTITISDRLSALIKFRKEKGLLVIWPPHVKELFSWAAQSVKGFISFHYGFDRPGHVDAVPYGYRAGGGY